MSQVTGKNSQNAKTKCWKCGLVCKNKQGLSTHQNKCLNGAPKGASFYRDERIELNTLPVRWQDLTNDKALPATQPLAASEEYVQELLSEWIEQLQELTKIAKSEPQAAYSAFVSGFQHKMTYFIRTIPDLTDILKPLDDYLTEHFIPAFTEGHILSEADRKLISLPVRYGGLGIPIYQELCTREYNNSRKVTAPLTPRIVSQEQTYVYSKTRERQIDMEIKKAREEIHKSKLQSLRSDMTPQQIRANDLAQMKGASAWLTSLPLQDEGFVLNKREFFDAISLRYRWNLKRTPTNCACNKPFDSDHAMQCPLGGYVIRRHNRVNT